MIEFAAKHKMLMRLHGPISPQCSPWAADDKRTPEELRTNLEEFMATLRKRYNDKPQNGTSSYHRSFQ
jgi:GH35 family endo-1,4-beta-xylanase